MIAVLKNWLYRKVVDAEIRRYTHNLAVLEQQMEEDAKIAETIRGYLALAIADTQSDRYQGAEISDTAYRAGMWQALTAAYFVVGVIGAVICWYS